MRRPQRAKAIQMGRNRKREDKGLPPYTYFAKGRWIYKPYLGCVDGKAKFGKEIRLCAGDKSTPKSTIWEAYEAKINNDDTKSLRYLLKQYLGSEKFLELAPATQKKYSQAYNTVSNTKLQDGRDFGDIPFAAITPGAIRKYLDRRARDGAPKAGNREMAFMSAAFTWSYNRDRLPKGMTNPCRGVERNPEKPRKLYIEDTWFQFVYDFAGERQSTPWYIQPMMEIAYLCRMRRCEILATTRADLLEDGLDTRRAKGSKDAITRWSDRLRAAVSVANGRPRSVVPLNPSKAPLLADSHGGAIQEEAFTTAWGRLMRAAVAKAEKEGVSFTRFTFHDIKAKGASDVKKAGGDLKKAGGWRTDKAANIYDRTKDLVDPTN